MTLAGHHLITIDDFSNSEIAAVLELASEMNCALDAKEQLNLCQGKELYTLFYEPSTRTRSSFETAMHRLGGTVVSHAEAQVTSSVAKGETIADTVRVLEKYADIIVMRHPLDGSTQLAADHSSVPIINGGDGAHEHPTQTLLDLYTIQKEKGSIKGKGVVLCGDLRHGRTVHSLAIGLARFGANITCIAPSGFEIPDGIRNILKFYECNFKEYTSLHNLAEQGSLLVRQPGTGEQASHLTKREQNNQEGFMNFLLESLDVLYFTRLQRERLADEESGKADESYFINKQLLERSREDALIMHPLPRTNELDYEVDQDKRAVYFRQAGYGVPVRMALIALLLDSVKSKAGESVFKGARRTDVSYAGAKCVNARCVTNSEEYVVPKCKNYGGHAKILSCYYCEGPMNIE